MKISQRPMSGTNLVRKSVVSGTFAGLLSSLALVVCGKWEVNDASAPLNGPSQWIYGKRAARRRGFHWPLTAWGILIHHAMSLLWAGVFEMLRKRTAAEPLSRATAAVETSALACFVDYRCTPERFTPGFERVLSKRALFAVYAAFAVGLWIGSALPPKP